MKLKALAAMAVVGILVSGRAQAKPDDKKAEEKKRSEVRVIEVQAAKPDEKKPEKGEAKTFTFTIPAEGKSITGQANMTLTIGEGGEVRVGGGDKSGPKPVEMQGVLRAVEEAKARMEKSRAAADKAQAEAARLQEESGRMKMQYLELMKKAEGMRQARAEAEKKMEGAKVEGKIVKDGQMVIMNLGEGGPKVGAAGIMMPANMMEMHEKMMNKMQEMMKRLEKLEENVRDLRERVKK